MKNLWILTEERPKKAVLKTIFEYFAKDQKCGFFGSELRILPILDENRCFSFVYEVIGFRCSKIDKVYIKTVSGNSSFTDFLVFYQEAQPRVEDIPIYAIEETKTDDKESRNTGVYQRCSKFVYIHYYYPQTKKIMLYNLQVAQKQTPTETYIFGTRLLMTLGVEILGKKLDYDVFKTFQSIDEVIRFKNNMRRPSKGNVPIEIKKSPDKIEISGRLYKSGGLAHDPNIGALSIISAVLRRLGWIGRIEITCHGLEQEHVGVDNKFVRIAHILGVELQGLQIPPCEMSDTYWHYETQGEKLGTIFMHVVVENFTESYSVFENHAGCEKGYFITSDGQHIPLAKYDDRDAYKAGDKSRIIAIPDLVLVDIKEHEIITIEGKKYINREKGIEELSLYNSFEKKYIERYYASFRIVRTVVLYGGREEQIVEIEVGFLLNENGRLVLGIKAPRLFHRAIRNLFDFWG